MGVGFWGLMNPNKKMNTLAGVVVLYHPDDQVENNILSYLSQVDLLVVVDNSPSISDALKNFLKK